MLGKADLDDAYKDKRFPDGAKLEMLFEKKEKETQGTYVHLSQSVYTNLPAFILRVLYGAVH